MYVKWKLTSNDTYWSVRLLLHKKFLFVLFKNGFTQVVLEVYNSLIRIRKKVRRGERK